jgi:hypothetical protein
VLKPGGVCIGSVAFLETWHDKRFYHHSHLGGDTIQSAGFVIDRVAPNAAWSSLPAQATTGLFPRVPRSRARNHVAVGATSQTLVACRSLGLA